MERSVVASTSVIAYLTAGLLFMVYSGHAYTQSSLDGCSDHFIDGDLDHTPTLYSSPPTTPYKNNSHHCYKANDTSFFALEYWPKNHSARWVAYKLGDNYGPKGCASRPRDEMKCYFKKQPWSEVEACVNAFREEGKKKARDPFHEDPFLLAQSQNRLKVNPFSNTGHDRGHLAPNNAFSWHLCGTYHTFSMANMSPQYHNLNRHVWARLEGQVLYWGAEHGPVYVVTGPIFNKFPDSRFRVYEQSELDASKIYKKNTKLPSFSSIDIPTNPDIAVPTGYYKVIYKPASNGEPPAAIGYLLPHTSEKISSFWSFTSRIDVIEKASGIRFSGIPDEMKARWGSNYFFSKKKGNWKLRNDCEYNYSASGWLENSTHQQRLDFCALQE
ncbi:DNA/RNA non-specific endonuclease [Gilvimarinus sp. SDUM040013]|uniref:DNA/RNA non-specific endonuclease n=1 Tax=Gilvimarinus gilvus TaxID=3058038 RepID=A0ABU4RZG1_9GAMM|nr:DNA/RNA non-specific endonuclease [Gilvimarinus sp. SDUM040013]MDO3388136.1 DNA/RNA non-specific endonuclease [Gilvimarinus sp. SDUM040013]MDX6850289.1 DNA/RNA non-specific endonuclease [Gilvimarinus sp. SDUM040013]